MTVNFRTSVPTCNYQRANQQKQKPAFGMAVTVPEKAYAGAVKVFLDKAVAMEKLILKPEQEGQKRLINISQKNPITIDGVDATDDKVVEGLQELGCKHIERFLSHGEGKLPTEAFLKKANELAEELFGKPKQS